jgi:hypothetical protein
MALSLTAVSLLILPPGLGLALAIGAAALVRLPPSLREAAASVTPTDLFDFHGWL